MSEQRGISSSSRMIGEAAKEQIGGVDKERALANYTIESQSHSLGQYLEKMRQGVYYPSPADMMRMQTQIDAWLQDPKVRVVIPMRESGGPPRYIPREVLSYLIKTVNIPPLHIIVCYHYSPTMNSPELTQQEAQSWGVQVIDVLKVMECLSPAVHQLAMKSELKVGKGLAMLSGILAVWMLNQQGGEIRHIVFHDSELGFMENYQGARYLAYPMVILGDCVNHVLQTHVGRNNEVPKAMHVALEALEYFHPDKSVRQFVRALRPAVMRMVHPCAGEFIIGVEPLLQLPLADGYNIETILRFGVAGYNLELRGIEAQVLNPNERLDGCNGQWAEQFMMNMIARGLLAFALMGKPSHRWSLDDILWLNKGFSQMHVLPGLPEQHGPMIGLGKSADRVLPSVNQLLEQDWVDLARLAELVP